MSRIVSVWLPRWPILRFLASQSPLPVSGRPVDDRKPFVLVAETSGGLRIAALNASAEAEGLRIGEQMADARAKIGGQLQIRPIDPAADHAALDRLAVWATRYTPSVSPWAEGDGADGLFLDVTGATHLVGGEESLLADLLVRLRRFGLQARLAMADTAGAAWALAHFHPRDTVVLPHGMESEALAPLPIEALRLSPATSATLRRLGFKRVGGLMRNPRAPFAARFPTELLSRLDQALGRMPEPLALISPPPVYRSVRQPIDTIVTHEGIVAGVSLLMQDVVPALVRDGVGARALRLTLYRIDGDVITFDLKLSKPSRDPAHIARLVDLRLDRIAGAISTEFGCETLCIGITAVEHMEPQQTKLSSTDDGADRADRSAALIDSLRQRLGPQSIRRIDPIASHLPERAEAAGFTGNASPDWSSSPDRLRPLLLLPRAEATEVMALVPEGPPRRFRWRGITHTIVHAQGPERIAGEWWHGGTDQPTRDYYIVENDAGHRFWLFREGLYGRETTTPRWFMHGLFA